MTFRLLIKNVFPVQDQGTLLWLNLLLFSYKGRNQRRDIVNIHTLLKSEQKKLDMLKNWPLLKNPQFLSNSDETW